MMLCKFALFLTLIILSLPTLYLLHIYTLKRAASQEQLMLTKELLKSHRLSQQNEEFRREADAKKVLKKAAEFAESQEEDLSTLSRAERKKLKKRQKKQGGEEETTWSKKEPEISSAKYIPGMENAIILDENSRKKKIKKGKKEPIKVDVLENKVESVAVAVADPKLDVPAPELYVYKEAKAPSQRILKKYIAKQCDVLKLTGKMSLPVTPLFNEKHKLLYISNPKCGSTSFKKFMRRLAGDSLLYEDMKEVHKEDDTENSQYIKNLYSESKEVQTKVFDEFYKVTFVRNPLVRLVSGYRNKIVRAMYTTMIQKIILKHYGAEAARTWLPRHKYRPSFEQFVDHILTTDDINNSHWAPYADKIQLCGFKYDMIGQLETADQHIDYLKKKLNTLEDIEFPPSRVEGGKDGHSSEQLTYVAYANLTKPQLASIYELYYNEFKLLGYSKLTDDHFPYIKLAEIVEFDDTNQDVQKASSKVVKNKIKTKSHLPVLPTDDSLLPPGDDSDTDTDSEHQHQEMPRSVNQQSADGDDPPGNDGDPPADADSGGNDDGPMPMD